MKLSGASGQIIGGVFLLLLLGILFSSSLLWLWLTPIFAYPGRAISALSH